MEITALRGRMLPPPLVLRLLAALVEVLLWLVDDVLVVLGRVPELVLGLVPLLGVAEPVGLLLPLGAVLLEGLLPLGAALPLGLLLGVVPLVGLLALGVFAEGSEVTGLFSANTGSVLAGRS